MSRRWWILIGALAIAAIVLGAAWVGRGTTDPTASGSPGAAVSTPTTAASTIPTATPGLDPTASPEPSPSAATTPPAVTATRPPRASGPPRLAYAAFLRRVNDDRETVETLNGALSTAAQAQDLAAVQHAAVDILDFVDTERDWLRDNPPADCYAAAHASDGADVRDARSQLPCTE